ncbi:MAG: hypothetical protein EOP83_15595, partial [Verrucomicrobiaceae bacterium]
MPDEPGSSPFPPPSRRLNQLLGVLIPILALAWFGYFHISRFLAAPYVVTAGKASYHPNSSWGTFPGPLTVEIEVDCNRRLPIPYCEMVVKSISDDAGNDLLAGSLFAKPVHTHQPFWTISYSGKEGGHFTSGASGNWQGSAEIHDFTWRIDVPRLPRPDIKSLHITGQIELWEGGEELQVKVSDLDFKAGTTFQIEGRAAEVVEFMEADKGNGSGTCVVTMSDAGFFPLRVECKSGARTEIESDPALHARPHWPQEPSKEFTFSFSTPSGVTRGDVTFHYRVNATHLILPVNLRYPIVPSKDRSSFPEEATTSRRRPDDKDWGTPLPPDRYPATRSYVVSTKVEADPRYPETSIHLALDTDGPDQPIASDIRIDRLHDGAGHDFLAPSPWRSSDYLPVSLSPMTGALDKPHYKLQVWSTGKVQGSGIYRLAFGSDATTVTVPGAASTGSAYQPILAPKSDHSTASLGPPIDLGSVRLLSQRTLSDSIEFKVEGNVGLIREITALDADG